LKSQHAEIDMCNNTIKIQGYKIQLAPVSISKFVITPFTFALINISASGASLCTSTEPGVLSDVTGVVSVLP
jgi:hypothetical protein